MSKVIQLKRATEAVWTDLDPVLENGEIGYEYDTGKLKIGNGTDVWSDLDYFGGSGGGITEELDPVFSSWLSTTPPLFPGGWYDTDQSSVNISGFSNDSGFLTYYDTINYAESSGYASSSDYANYAYAADYVTYESDPTFGGCPADSQTYGWNNGAWTVVAGDTTFTQWRDGTIFQPTGPCQFDDDPTTPTKYARYWNTANSSLTEWWDGTNTLTIGGTEGLSYLSGDYDVMADLDGTYCQFIDAGTSIPSFRQNTKDSVDTVIPIDVLSRRTTGTAANGIGGSQDYYLTNDNGDQVLAARISVEMTDVTTASEDSVIKFYVLRAGTLTLAHTIS